jgi:adenylylsulfate kinase-like enzyme
MGGFPKGLYKKARSGLIPNMTGINSPYESPLKPDLIINTNEDNVEKSIEIIIKKLTL